MIEMLMRWKYLIVTFLPKKMALNDLFVHYKNNEDVTLLCVMLPNMSRYTISMMLRPCPFFFGWGWKINEKIQWNMEYN